jgi:glycosyltransferase involved in cell wall biosynthesis
MITYRSVERLGRDLFLRVLHSSLAVPYKSIILVDDSPTPDTRYAVLQFADEHGKELVVQRSKLYGGAVKPTRATARQTAIDVFQESFSEEWLMFLDDDFVLSPTYWAQAQPHTAEARVGEIWGVNWDATPDRERFINTLNKLGLSKKTYVQYLLEAFSRRGGTHDTLYRRAALNGVLIPPELHVYEDAWLHHYVRCGGWESRVVYDSGRHYSPPKDFSVAEEKRRWINAVSTAVKYGIVEYEYIERAIRSGADPARWALAWLSLARPILGFPLQLAVDLAITKNLVKALKRTVAKQYLKLWNRYVVLREARRVRGRLPDVCEAVRSHVAKR